MIAAAAAVGACTGVRAEPAQIEELARPLLEELSNVTSLSRSAAVLRAAPASIYVITHEEIMRAGVTSIGEAQLIRRTALGQIPWRL